MAENDNNKGPVKASSGARPEKSFSTNNIQGSRRTAMDEKKSFQNTKPPSKSKQTKKGK